MISEIFLSNKTTIQNYGADLRGAQSKPNVLISFQGLWEQNGGKSERKCSCYYHYSITMIVTYVFAGLDD